MRRLFLAALVGAVAYAATPALADGPAKVAESAMGKIFVDGKGMTLYTFDKDVAGKSNCNGPCATAWPPLMATDDVKSSGDWSIVMRDDGTKQWAYKGEPLYTWVKDEKPGDVTGHGFKDVWRIAKP